MHGTMVGNCHSTHVELLAFFQEIIDADCSVKQAVLGVNVKVGKVSGRCIRHGSLFVFDGSGFIGAGMFRFMI
jgi:hypothetical protein